MGGGGGGVDSCRRSVISWSGEMVVTERDSLH